MQPWHIKTRVSTIIEPCHGKTSFKIFVVVILKEGLAGPCTSLFGYDTDYKIVLCYLHRLYSKVGVIPKEGLAGPARQSLFGYDNYKDINWDLRHVFLWHGSSLFLPEKSLVVNKIQNMFRDVKLLSPNNVYDLDVVKCCHNIPRKNINISFQLFKVVEGHQG